MARLWTDLCERDVVKQCCDLLVCCGWTVINRPSGLLARPGKPRYGRGARLRVGENGASDKICVRPVPGKPGRCDFFYLELKAPGGELSPDQKIWAESVRICGYLYAAIDSVVGLERWLNENFP